MLGENMRALRRQKGISLFRLAVEVGCTDRTLQALETGRAKNPTLELLLKLADFFNVSIDELVGHKPPKKKDPRPMIMLPLDKVGEKAKHSR